MKKSDTHDIQATYFLTIVMTNNFSLLLFPLVQEEEGRFIITKIY